MTIRDDDTPDFADCCQQCGSSACCAAANHPDDTQEPNSPPVMTATPSTAGAERARIERAICDHWNRRVTLSSLLTAIRQGEARD